MYNLRRRPLPRGGVAMVGGRLRLPGPLAPREYICKYALYVYIYIYIHN